MSELASRLAVKVRKKIWPMLMCVAIVGSCMGLLLKHYRSYDGVSLISSIENWALDQRFRWRGPIKATGKIGILAIDEKSLQKFGRWPISRKNYEKVFQNLKKLGAEWVGFDVVWSAAERPGFDDVEPSLARLKTLAGKAPADWADRVSKEVERAEATRDSSLADQAMIRMIKDYEKIVLGYFYYGSRGEAEALGEKAFDGLDHMEASAIQATVLPSGKELKDYPNLKAFGIVANLPAIGSVAPAHAFFNNDSDTDAIMRWVTLVREVNGNLMPSLSLKLAAQILKKEPVVEFDEVGVKDITLLNPDDDQDLLKIPIDHKGSGRILINHLGPDKTIPHFSIADVYDGTLTPEQQAALKGTSLILGPTAIAINDQRANPFDAGINGVEDHAAAIDNILSGRFMRRTETIYRTELMLVLAIGLLFAPIMVFGRAVFSGVAALLFLVGYYYFDKTFWFGRGEWVYMGMPFIEIGSLFLSTMLYKYIVEEREKRSVTGAFGQYLSPEVIEELMQSGEAPKLGGERKELTVFFSDVRGFTTLSENLSPEKLGELMNLYFTPMADIILGSKGTLDKYIGDAIMCFWGTPIKLENHADIGVKSAVQMLFEMDKLRVDLPKKGFPVIDIGIGLNSDMMSVGNFGSPQRKAYTVMGDAVNLGARLEGTTKDYGVKIIISEFTQKRLTSKDIYTRDLDKIKVKGKNEPVTVYEVMRPDMLRNDTDMRTMIGEFERGRVAYMKQDWDAAKKHFMQCLLLRPDDGPANLYLKRIEEFKAENPGTSWDGVYVFKHK
jgi:adenylate cyclase